MERNFSERLVQIVVRALELPASDRDAFLERTCGDDDALREAVDGLLLASPKAQEWLRKKSTSDAPSTIDASELTTRSSATQPSGMATGKRVGPYRILELIGEGGMGEVFRAEQTEPMRRTVALKVIKRGMDTKEVIRRFEAERQALALLDHPNIAKVFDAGSTPNGRPYFAMEYVHGVPITTYCDRHKLSTPERLKLFIRLCDGVQHAHQKAIIHRDLKPSNVLVMLVDDQPMPVIIDFGVVKAMGQKLTENTLYTAIGELIGTPEYMSPEQAEMTGEDIDTRTDVYALGVILYQLLAGALPFEPEELRQAGIEGIVRMIREKEPPRPSTKLSTMGERASDVAAARRTVPGKLTSQLRGDLDWIVMKAMEKDRTRRFGSASELAADVLRHLHHQPVIASPPNVAYRARKFIRRHRLGVSVVLASAVVLFAFGVSMAVQARRVAVERDRARQESEHRKEVSEFLESLFADIDPFHTGGQSVNLRDVLDRGAQRVHQQLDDQPSVQADLMLTLGDVYSNIGLVESATPLLDEALRLRRGLFGDEHVEVGRALSVQGNHELERRNIAQADSLFGRALQIMERSLGSGDPEVAEVLRQIAVVRRHQERYAEAESLYVTSMEILQAHFGSDNALVGKVASDLGALHYFTDDLQRAEARTRQAMQIYENVEPVNYSLYGESMNNMGAILLKQEKDTEAAAVFEEALDVQRQHLGSHHPHVARTLSWLGRTYRDLGRFREAVTMQDEAYRIYATTLGDENPRVQRLLQGLQRSVDAYAQSLVEAGRTAEADSLVEHYQQSTPLGQ